MQIDKNNRRCLKFTGYVYLPKETGKPVTWNNLRYFAMRLGSGRVSIYKENSKELIGHGKALAFNNFGTMLHHISKEYIKRSAKRLPTEAQLKRRISK